MVYWLLSSGNCKFMKVKSMEYMLLACRKKLLPLLHKSLI
uniref:Uncharacterized protein n=1 Tax=Rhizophora mucronata TaxID=61149 RepID=A0A2P2M616_RHIMU